MLDILCEGRYCRTTQSDYTHTHITMADDILKELLKLESLSSASTSGGPSRSSKSKASAAASLQATLSALEDTIDGAETRLNVGASVGDVLSGLEKDVEKRRGEADKGLKEWYTALGKVGKAIDKVSYSYPSSY